MKTLLLLHGALGSAEQMAPLADALSGGFAVHCLNFSGHGGAAPKEQFSVAGFAAEVLACVRENELNNVAVFGYSMGGYVALYLAAHHPELVNSVITLGTKFQWNAQTAANETAHLNPERIEEKLPAFAAQLEERHRPNNWKELIQKTAGLLTQLGQQPPLTGEVFQRITCDVLLLLGDRDKMVTEEETLAVIQQLPSAQMELLQDTPHPIEKVNLQRLVFSIQNFLQ